MSDATQPCLGVMGGLGPAATVSFLNSLIKRTPVRRDADHLRILIDNNPKVPDINAAVLGDGVDAGPALCAMARGLQASGADFLVLVCNAGHWYEKAIQEAVSIPLLSMPKLAVGQLAASAVPVSRCGVLATDGGLKSGVYQRALEAAGIEPVLPSEAQLARAMAALARVRAGVIDAQTRGELVAVIDQFAEQGAQYMIAACTEIPLAVGPGDVQVPLLDPMDALVEAVLRHVGLEPLPAS